MFINEAGWGAIGVVIFCLIAWRYGAKPFVEVLDNRAKQVQDKLEEAEQLRKEAKDVLNNYKRLQQEAEQEAKNILERAEEHAKQLQINAEENTKALIARQEKQAKQKINAAEKQALVDVKNLVIDLSIKASEETMKDEIDEKKSTSLILDSSKKLNLNI